MKYCYEDKNLSRSSLEIVEAANVIIDEYVAEGYELTLRQLYYQFVARDLLANTAEELRSTREDHQRRPAVWTRGLECNRRPDPVHP